MTVFASSLTCSAAYKAHSFQYIQSAENVFHALYVFGGFWSPGKTKSSMITQGYCSLHCLCSQPCDLTSYLKYLTIAHLLCLVSSVITDMTSCNILVIWIFQRTSEVYDPFTFVKYSGNF